MLQYAELSNWAMRRLAVLRITLAGNRRYNDGVGIPVPRIILQNQNRPVTSLFRKRQTSPRIKGRHRKRQTSPRIKGRHLKETVAHRDGGQLFCST